MKAVFFIRQFPPYAKGATYSALQLAKGLRNEGVTIEFIVENIDGTWRNSGNYEGFTVRSFYLSQPGKWRVLSGILSLLRYLRTIDFDIFHIHGGSHRNLLIGWLIQVLCKKKVLLKITLDEWDTPDGVVKGRFGKLSLYFYRRLDAIVAMTSGQLKKLKNWDIKSLMTLIPNSVDTERFKKDRFNNNDLNISSCRLLFVGALSERKGFDILLKVFKELCERHNNIHLTIVGDYGVDCKSSKFNKLLEKFNIKLTENDFKKISLQGQVENPEAFYRDADIFIFPSRLEGFGTVQIEAMASELPCVANNISGVSRDIFPSDDYGILINDNKVERYIFELEKLIENKKLRELIGSKAREYVCQNFSIASTARRYIKVYQELLESSK